MKEEPICGVFSTCMSVCCVYVRQGFQVKLPDRSLRVMNN